MGSMEVGVHRCHVLCWFWHVVCHRFLIVKCEHLILFTMFQCLTVCYVFSSFDSLEVCSFVVRFVGIIGGNEFIEQVSAVSGLLKHSFLHASQYDIKD